MIQFLAYGKNWMTGSLLADVLFAFAHAEQSGGEKREGDQRSGSWFGYGSGSIGSDAAIKKS